MVIICINLEIDGDVDEVMEVVDAVLQQGTLQEAINKYAVDNRRDCLVMSANVGGQVSVSRS